MAENADRRRDSVQYEALRICELADLATEPAGSTLNVAPGDLTFTTCHHGRYFGVAAASRKHTEAAEEWELLGHGGDNRSAGVSSWWMLPVNGSFRLPFAPGDKVRPINLSEKDFHVEHRMPPTRRRR